MAIIQAAELRENIDNPTALLEAVKGAYKEWEKDLSRLEKLDQYYRGEHAILKREMRENLPNNKIVANYAKYISDMATGYLIGKPVKYDSDSKDIDLTNTMDVYSINDTESLDADIGKDCSVFGRAYELDYQDEDGVTRMAVLDPQTAFLVADDSLEHKPLYGVHIAVGKDGDGENVTIVTAYTSTSAHIFVGKSVEDAEYADTMENILGRVPLIEYVNNEEMMGDFEPVISLIDAYNQLTSDRLNAKEQDIDALLALYGVETPSKEDTKLMREERVIGMPEGSKAEWLIKQLSESDNETVRGALNEDIHKFSLTPDLTDENFAGNSSGVAMEYKVMGFDQLIAIKQRYFKAGLKQRLINVFTIQLIKGDRYRKGGAFKRFIRKLTGEKDNPEFDVADVKIKFTRNMPVNELEIAQIVQSLSGIVSKQTLYSMIPEVEDPQDEIKRLQEEQKQALKVREDAFGYPDAQPADEQEDGTEEEPEDES